VLTSCIFVASQIVTISPGEHDFSNFIPVASKTYVFKKGIHRFKGSIVIRENRITFKAEPGAKLVGSAEAQPAPLNDTALIVRLSKEARNKVKLLRFRNNQVLGNYVNRGFRFPIRPSQSELFVDGKAQRPARYPNIGNVDGGWQRTGESNSNFSFRVTDRRLKDWKDDGNIWAYGFFNFDWADSSARVKQLGDEVRLEESKDGSIAAYGIKKGRRFIFTNVLEELDEPGEYWIDSQNNQMLAWVPEDAKSIEVSVLDKPFFRIEGAEKIKLEGLSFEFARGNGIEIENSRNVLVTHSSLKNIGGSGIRVTGGKDCVISNSRLSEIGANGVFLTGGDREKLIPSEHRVENCEISRVGRYFRTNQPAIDLQGVGQIVRRCTLENLPHQAVFIKGNNHLIELCEIRKTDLETSDASAVYIGRSFVDRGTVIRYNRFSEIEPRTFTEGNLGELVMAVYIDDNQAGVSTIGNIFDLKGYGVFIGGGSDNVVKGNIFLNNAHAIHVDNRANTWAKENFQRTWGYHEAIKASPWSSPAWRKQYPNLARALDNKEDISSPRSIKISGNVCVGSWLRLFHDLKESDFEMKGNILLQDKGVSMKELLKLVKAQGTDIPVNQIGAKLKRDTY
jgi:hypothetical protein